MNGFTTNLCLNIDEFTFSIFCSEKNDSKTWEECAELILENFVRNTKINIVFNGNVKDKIAGNLQGYTRTYDFGLKDYYFAMAYNERVSEMGVCVKFSAKAWSIYQAKYQKIFNEMITLSEFIHMVSDPIKETVRLSRIDMTADYFNYDFSLNDLYEALSNESVIVKDYQGKKRIKNLSFIGKHDSIETIYLGSKKANTRSFLRIYDKRKEQIANHGFRVDEIKKCHSWIRFEAVYKGNYAHTISETILSRSMDAITFNRFIAHTILQKYRFVDEKGDYTAYTKDLIAIAEGEIFPSLVCSSPRDNALRQSIRHILSGSGLFPTVYKIEKIYGTNAGKEFAIFLYHSYKSMSWMSNGMKRELDIWLEKHSDLKNTELSDNY